MQALLNSVPVAGSLSYYSDRCIKSYSQLRGHLSDIQLSLSIFNPFLPTDPQITEGLEITPKDTEMIFHH